MLKRLEIVVPIEKKEKRKKQTQIHRNFCFWNRLLKDLLIWMLSLKPERKHYDFEFTKMVSS